MVKELPDRIAVEDLETLLKEMNLSGVEVGSLLDESGLVLTVGRRIKAYRREGADWLVYDSLKTIGAMMGGFFREKLNEPSFVYKILPPEEK
jgi:hypothetical protein